MPRTVFIGLLLIAAPGLAQELSVEELTAIVQQQQQRIEVLERQQGETESELDATADYVETIGRQSSNDATTFGGYGELHYNNLSADDPANDVEEIDFHRFVLFIGHRFSDKVRFFSELEVEHSLAGDGAPGEVELEQAYVDVQLNNSLSARAGLFLLPIGFLNETHEPPTFYGVERNSIENIIVPTTWWEGGGGFSGTTASGLGWDVAMHSGLQMPVTGGSAFRVRSGRQKVAEALNNNWAYTARVRYSGIPGLELAASYQYQTDPSQMPGDGLDSGQLLVANATYRADDFMIKALYGDWTFDGVAVEAAGADDQKGWFVEPSYRLNDSWGIYTRYEDVEGARSVDQFSQWEAGVNYWLNPNVVFKFDYRQRDLDMPTLAGENFDGFDLGFGYQF